MEVTVSRKKMIVITLLLLAAGGILAWLFIFGGIGAIQNSFATPTPDTADQESHAASEGAAAYYTLSTTEGIEGWLDRLCAISTPAGCEFAKNSSVPAFKALLESSSVEAVATAKVIEKIEGDGANTTSVWRTQVTLDNSWQGFVNPQTVFVVVARDGNTWRFERVMFEQEAQARYGLDQ